MNKLIAIISLFFGIFHFMIFGYDIEMGRDFFTWMWLLISQLWFILSIRYWIKYDQEQK